MNETAELRVVHASPDAPNVDVYVDGDAVLENVSFGGASDYLELPTGSHEIEVTAAGDPSTSVFEDSIEFGSATYTAVALGEVSNRGDEPFSLEVLEDDNSQPPEGEARVRVVHASPDAPNVDVTAGGDALFEDVGFGGSGYVTVPEGNYTLQVRAAQEDNEGEVVDTLDLSAEAGSVYTAFAVGYVQPVGSPGDEPFDIIPTVDSAPEEPEAATVSFGNQTSDGSSVTVDSVYLPEGGFVVMHDSTLVTEGDAIGSVVGVSDYLGAGEHEDVSVSLSEGIDESQELIAMPHRDTNGNEEYEFGESEGSDDGPYTADGGAVTDAGQVTVEGAGPSVTFEDQTLGEDGAVDVSVNDAALEQGSWLVVTYEDNGSLVIAGVSELADSNDLTVTVGDAGGFPGAHTAHVISNLSTADYAPGDTVSEETAGNVLVNANAEVTEAMDDGGMDGGMDGNDTDGGTDGGMDGNESDGTDGNETDGEGDDGGQGMPGFTAVAALVALVAAALVARNGR
jgi:PGF-CTERM protein